MLIKVIDTILYIDSFDQKCVIIKKLLQSELLKQHMVNIGAYQSLNTSDLYEHICLENIKVLYKSAEKCDHQQQYKAII